MKDCLTCKHSSSGYDEIPCIGCLEYSLYEEYEIKIKQMKKSQPLLKKYFIMWLKITKLIYQIFILERVANTKLSGKGRDMDYCLPIYSARELLKAKQKELKELVR